MSSMKILKSERGALNALLIALILASLLLLGSLGFGAWAFASREDYKKNSDDKSAKASAVAVQQANTTKDNEFVEKEKQPLKGFTGPEALGSINFQYPKTWSMLDSETSNKISLTLHPDRISDAKETAYALRVEVLSTTYDQSAATFSANIKAGTVKASAYSLPKQPTVVGLRLDGLIAEGKQGSSVILPLRDKTIKIYTEAPQYVNDFNTLILPNFNFKP